MKYILGTLILLVIILSGWYFINLQPVNKKDSKDVYFIVAPGQGLSTTADSLKSNGLIKDRNVFIINAKISGADKKIQSGEFILNRSMSNNDILIALEKGAIDIWVTIPEGFRADEIADLLSEKVTTYDESWRTELNKNEGYLFPDTYLIPKDANLTTVVSAMRNNFDTKYASVSNPNNMSEEEIVKIASLIEREGKHDEDRSIISSVIHNRLGIDMGLQIDATVQYALGYQKSEDRWWKKGLTVNDLAYDSPYNTYKYSGLPPTPISNPGLESLQAAANPADTDYIFYITDVNGINHYAKTLEEHNQNIAEYGLSR